jgi:hypothetical protein
MTNRLFVQIWNNRRNISGLVLIEDLERLRRECLEELHSAGMARVEPHQDVIDARMIEANQAQHFVAALDSNSDQDCKLATAADVVATYAMLLSAYYDALEDGPRNLAWLICAARLLGNCETLRAASQEGVLDQKRLAKIWESENGAYRGQRSGEVRGAAANEWQKQVLKAFLAARAKSPRRSMTPEWWANKNADKNWEKYKVKPETVAKALRKMLKNSDDSLSVAH